jgi:hypothetical protein
MFIYEHKLVQIYEEQWREFFKTTPPPFPLLTPEAGAGKPDVSPVKGTAGPGASRPWHSWRGSVRRRFGEATQPTMAVSPAGAVSLRRLHGDSGLDKGR